MLPGLFALGFGVLAGIALSIHGIRTALRKYRSKMVWLILGLMLGSLYAIANGPASLDVPLPPLDLATFDTINLSFDLYYQREWSWDDVSAYVTEAINGYFLELAQSWADQNEALVVRISQVESRLLGITGILDIANTKINGEAANCTLTLDHIPVLGTIEPGTIVISG